MTDQQIRADLNWLVENPERTLGSVYHDAARCWQLIEAALQEIRKLRRDLALLREATHPADGEDHEST